MKKLMTTFFAAALAACAFSDELMTNYMKITDVTLGQSSRNQDVIVKYKLENNNIPVFIQLDILTNGISIGRENIKTLVGDVSTGTNLLVSSATADKTIVWKARTDWRGHLETNVEACVLGYYTNDIAELSGVYMVVDLSGGPTATSYPVSYTLETPKPLVDTSCASNHLWLKRVEPGSFTIGSPADELGHQSNEAQAQVRITKAYFAGVFPVTLPQWQLVTGQEKTKSDMKAKGTAPIDSVSYDLIRGTNDASNSYFWPATKNVAPTSFMGLIRAKTGMDGFDLPTEAQWEYACRAGTTGAWNDGTTITNATADLNLDALGWYAHNVSNSSAPVGQKRPNSWGLYDMHGNVFEWCLDLWNGTAATGGDDPVGPATHTYLANRAQRGGAWSQPAGSCRAAHRNVDNRASGSQAMGFRLFCVLQ